MSQKKKMLSIKEKMEVLNVVDKENLSVRALAKRFNIGKTQAATLVKQKEDIKRIWMGGDNVNKKKKFLNADGSKIDHLSFEWFVKARSQNIPISGIQKAPLECSDFEAEDDIPISTLAALIKILNENQQGQYTEEFLLIDEVVNTEDNNIDVVIDEINTEELSDGESEDSNHVCVQDECQIKSYPEALEQLRRIKQFLRDDITGFQYAKTLECHLENLFLKHKQENLRQTTVYEFLKPKI